MHTVPPPPKDHRKNDSHRRYFWFALAAVAVVTLAFWAFSFRFLGTFIHGSDGQLYYAQVRSLVIDHDLDFNNEMTELSPHLENYKEGVPRAANGRVANRHTFGWALVMLLPFEMIHLLVKLAGGNASGYSWPYEVVFSLWQASLCVFGMAMAARATIRLTGRTAAALAFVTTFLASNVLYYAAVMPIMTHGSSCAVVGLLLYCGVRLYEDVRRWLFWGLSAGLVFLLVLLRPTNIVLAGVLMPAVWTLWNGDPAKLGIPAGKSTGWGLRWVVPRFGLVVLAVGLAVGLQILVWRASMGYWTMNPYAEHGETMDLLSPALPQVLISTNNGAWYFHPFYMIGFAGLIWGTVKGFRPGRVFWSWLLTGYVLHIYIHSCWFAPTFGDAFGHRLFADSSPLMLAGSALLYYRVRSTVGRGVIAGTFAVLVAWNLLLTLSAATFNLSTTDIPRPPSVVIDAQIKTIKYFVHKIGL
ncbi:MAG: hypothetical protein K8S99_06285 [Planctomycetes bacterium]|nr:hypothetical protein [Planctomycetota bacterium]